MLKNYIKFIKCTLVKNNNNKKKMYLILLHHNIYIYIFGKYLWKKKYTMKTINKKKKII
jgi:hypothetical protein